jgi:hypothetical protein
VEARRVGWLAVAFLASTGLNESDRAEIDTVVTFLGEEVADFARSAMKWALVTAVSAVFATVLTAKSVPP